MENNNNKELEEWLQLVHEGSCCACVDPMKEEKQEDFMPAKSMSYIRKLSLVKDSNTNFNKDDHLN